MGFGRRLKRTQASQILEAEKIEKFLEEPLWLGDESKSKLIYLREYPIIFV